jgi:murein DD-endopeptidase MepM/ murein hydrolase activator NlpD
LLALNKKIDPIKNTDKTVWSQKNTKNVLERAKATKKVPVPTRGFAKHTVETGETIYSIARLYNVSVTSLAKLNNLDAEFTIYLGQNITIPITQNKLSLPEKKVKTTSKKLVGNQKNNSVPISKKQNTISTKNTFVMPVKGKIISRYNPNNEKQKNQGIDFQVSPGSPVFAAASGNVALITDNTENFGKIVLIRHKNNLISIYGRVAKVLVKKNEVVTKGQKIGSMAEKANDSKNQTILHFELRRGTQSINPENYFE